jgi:hypothetical protein
LLCVIFSILQCFSWLFRRHWSTKTLNRQGVAVSSTGSSSALRRYSLRATSRSLHLTFSWPFHDPEVSRWSHLLQESPWMSRTMAVSRQAQRYYLQELMGGIMSCNSVSYVWHFQGQRAEGWVSFVTPSFCLRPFAGRQLHLSIILHVNF